MSIGVHWCPLVSIGVHWCPLVSIRGSNLPGPGITHGILQFLAFSAFFAVINPSEPSPHCGAASRPRHSYDRLPLQLTAPVLACCVRASGRPLDSWPAPTYGLVRGCDADTVSPWLAPCETHLRMLRNFVVTLLAFPIPHSPFPIPNSAPSYGLVRGCDADTVSPWLRVRPIFACFVTSW